MQEAGQSWERAWPTVWQSAVRRQPRIKAPPGLGRRKDKEPVLSAQDVLQGVWGNLSDSTREELKKCGLEYSAPEVPVDLREVCRKHLQSLPECIRKLVAEPEEPVTYGQAVSDLNRKYKKETAELRDLVTQSASLQAKIDTTKELYQQHLRSMQALTEQLTAKQKAVESLQKELQVKLGEAEVKQSPQDDQQTFGTFFDALEKAGLQLDETQREKVREQLGEPPLLQGQKRRRVAAEADAQANAGEAPLQAMQQG